MRGGFAGLSIALAVLLAGCGGQVERPRPVANRPAPVRRPVAATPIAPQPAAPVAASTANAAGAGVVAGPPVYTLPIDEAAAARALVAFQASCPSLLRRSDLSGLTRGSD
ncbi:hypothetical protein C1X73_32050, partial [Pseudomonas sp. FW305-130]